MKAEIISQYKAALLMLSDTINRCPEVLWVDDSHYENSYWRIVYHTLHYAALYLSNSLDDFVPWPKHIANHHVLGNFTKNAGPTIITTSYEKADMQKYSSQIIDNLEKYIDAVYTDEQCGFPWLPMSRFQLHLYNVRHIQHHTGQLIERLHQVGIKGIEWVR